MTGVLSGYVFLVFFFAVLSAGAATEIATDRGRSSWWAAAGFVFPLAAPLLVWLMPPSARVYDRCEHCTEYVRPRAVVCPHCPRSIQGVRAAEAEAAG